MIKRTAIRQAVLAVFDEYRLTAVVYPTLRRKAARIGDAQAGTNCQLSSHSGLPGLGVPAGFTDDGVPVGMDLLGRDFNDAELLSIGFALERSANWRRVPFSTPALIGGRAPASARVTTAIGEFSYDTTTSTLFYRTNVDRDATIWIHRGDEQKPGPALYQLFPGTGAVTLSYVDREALRGGKLFVRVYTTQGAVQNVKLGKLRQ